MRAFLDGDDPEDWPHFDLEMLILSSADTPPTTRGSRIGAMDGLRRSLCLGVLAVGAACSSASKAKLDGSAPPGSGGAVSVGGSGAGGSGGLGGTNGPSDGGLGGAFGSGGLLGTGGGTAGLTGSGGKTGGVVSSGARTGGVAGSGGQAGWPPGSGGASVVVDAAGGGVVGSGGQSADSGGKGGPDAGVALDVLRRETISPTPPCGELTGTLGGAATAESSMKRYAVTGKDCYKYIVQNNNFANPTGSVQTLTCVGASFEVVGSTASSASGSILPASFPSIYIGANGAIANGAYATWTDSDLPIQISKIASAQTSFDWSAPTPAGEFAATVDVWFAKAAPIAGAYDDAVSGSLMIWLGKPSSRQPVGERVRQATIAGRAWDVWVGPHGATALGTDDASRPVVSYVVQNGPLTGLDFDLINFITDAVANSGADMSAGRTSQAFESRWYLTDVIAGFQIWTGSDATGLRCTRFACQVKR
jgi:hypothetical protein